MSLDILNMTIDKTQNIPILVGNTSSFNIKIKNLSNTLRLYNLSLFLNLPDGMVLSSSTLPQTSSIPNIDGSANYSWVNLKDLAPLEVDYTFSITVQCNTKFKSGDTIPFDYIFSGITVLCQVDTMPRGSYDIGNQILTQQLDMTFKTVRFYSTISTSGKVLKGAGTSSNLDNYTQIQTTTCKFFNNAVSTSSVNISILLEDGIRYIGNISISGADSSKFINPTISSVNIDGKIYTQIYYGNINLSINSNTTLTFNYAVWNQYNNNQGDFIIHGTVLNMHVNMYSADPLIVSNSNSETKFTAMDLIINTYTNNRLVDVQDYVTYTYTFRVGQYYDVEDIIVNYYLPDGISYVSSSSTPTSIDDNPVIQGLNLTYNFSLAAQNSSTTITIYAKIDSYYRYKKDSQSINLPVVASDPFLATTNILGILIGPFSTVTDNSSTSSSISVGSIDKQFIKGYYKDGTPKNIDTLAPGDLAEYLLSYNASSLKAIQKEVYIDDFFPLSVDPIDNLNYIYTGYNPILSPQLISPHGVDFYYGDIPGLSSSSINFKVPIAQLGSSTQNVNLMKLKGINTYGYAYSNRDQVNFNIGTPNLQLTKSVNGPNKNSIKVNEVYTYSITISNTNNLGTETDAFNFILSDTLSSWFVIDQNSINVSGSGSYSSIDMQNESISVNINKLSPGQSLTLTYKVTIISTLAPKVTIKTTATNTNPYSQIYEEGSTNFQYSNLIKSASTTLSSASITLTKTNISDVFKVGSPITYILSVAVPQGTIAYGLYLKDILPSGGQSYLGPASRNNEPITPIISSNTVTFPSEGTIDARVTSQTIKYNMTCTITNANKTLNSTTSTQTNSIQCFYQQIQGGSFSSVSKNLSVTINHPNLVMNLTAIDKSDSTLYNQNANITTNSIMQFKLTFKNNSSIKLVNGTIEIPLNNNFLFTEINTSIFCNAYYNSSSNKIVISIPILDVSNTGYVIFTAIPQSTLRSGTSIPTQATAISYYNDISTIKIYGGEKSNIITCSLSPGVSLTPDPLTKINDSTSFIVTQPGNTAVIVDYFKNIGGGYDDFTLIIQKVGIPYTLYIDNIKIADVPKNTLYQQTLPIMSNLAPNTTKVIKIHALIPYDNPLGTRYDFIVTAKSVTNPYPEQTVLNIDPSF